MDSWKPTDQTMEPKGIKNEEDKNAIHGVRSKVARTYITRSGYVLCSVYAIHLHVYSAVE